MQCLYRCIFFIIALLIAIPGGCGSSDSAGQAQLPRFDDLVGAIKRGDLDEVRSALDAGYDVNQQDDRGMTLLHYSGALGMPQASKLLISCGANVDIRDYHVSGMPIHHAAGSPFRSIARGLGQTRDRAECIQIYIDHGADIDAKAANGLTPILLAAYNNDEEMVYWLDARGANANLACEAGTLIHAIIFDNNNVEQIERVVDFAAANGVHINDVNSKGKTAIFVSVEQGSYGAAEVLLQRGADVNRSDKRGDTALISAAEREDLRLVKLLLEHNADASVLGSRAMTALEIAKERENAELIQLIQSYNG